MPAVRPQTLNNVFQQAADQARQKLPELTHNQKVGGRNKNHVALLFRSLRVCNLLFRFFLFFSSAIFVSPMWTCALAVPAMAMVVGEEFPIPFRATEMIRIVDN